MAESHVERPREGGRDTWGSWKFVPTHPHPYMGLRPRARVYLFRTVEGGGGRRGAKPSSGAGLAAFTSPLCKVKERFCFPAQCRRNKKMEKGWRNPTVAEKREGNDTSAGLTNMKEGENPPSGPRTPRLAPARPCQCPWIGIHSRPLALPPRLAVAIARALANP